MVFGDWIFELLFIFRTCWPVYKKKGLSCEFPFYKTDVKHESACTLYDGHMINRVSKAFAYDSSIKVQTFGSAPSLKDSTLGCCWGYTDSLFQTWALVDNKQEERLVNNCSANVYVKPNLKITRFCTAFTFADWFRRALIVMVLIQRLGNLLINNFRLLYKHTCLFFHSYPFLTELDQYAITEVLYNF